MSVERVTIGSATLYLGDSLEVLQSLEPGSVAGQSSPLYFARPAHAAAYVEANKPAPAPAPQRAVLSEAELKTLATNEKKRAAAHKARPPMGPRTTPTAKQNITFSPPKTSDSQPRPQGQAVETEATRRTIDSTPRPNSRIEAAPAMPPDPRWPSFSSTPLGVNPDTGRPWA